MCLLRMKMHGKYRISSSGKSPENPRGFIFGGRGIGGFKTPGAPGGSGSGVSPVPALVLVISQGQTSGFGYIAGSNVWFWLYRWFKRLVLVISLVQTSGFGYIAGSNVWFWLYRWFKRLVLGISLGQTSGFGYIAG